MSSRCASNALNTACRRCRRRKVKCDLKAPKCTNCSRADVLCISADLKSSRAAGSLPPGYLESLEAELSQLETQALRAHQVSIFEENRILEACPASGPPVSGELQGCSTPFDWATIGEVGSSKPHPRLAYGIKNMVRDAISVDNSHPFHSLHVGLLHHRANQPSISPQEHPLASMYLASYFHDVHSCLPFLHDNEPEALLARSQPQNSIESAVLLMALATGAILLPGHNPMSAYNAVMFHEAARESFESSPPSSSLHTVHFLLLATLFSLYSPTGGSTWHLLGLAIQVSIMLGLHHRRGIELQANHGPVAENTFWTVYVLDRLVSATLGRPYGIADQDITTEAPAKQARPSNVWYLSVLACASSLPVTEAHRWDLTSDDLQRAYSELTQRPLPERNCDVFGSIAFQLAILSTADVSSVRKYVNVHSGNLQNNSGLRRLWLSHCRAQKKYSAPLQWVSAYTIFHTVVLQKCAQRLQVLDTPIGGNEGTDSSILVEAVDMCLLSVSLSFPGLEGLFRVSKRLIESSAIHEIKDNDLEAVQSESVKAAVRTLINLIPRDTL